MVTRMFEDTIVVCQSYRVIIILNKVGGHFEQVESVYVSDVDTYCQLVTAYHTHPSSMTLTKPLSIRLPPFYNERRRTEITLIFPQVALISDYTQTLCDYVIMC